MNFSEQCYRIFEQATKAYHVSDDVDATMHNPYEVKSIEFYLYLKNWIDAVQWHLEDIDTISKDGNAVLVDVRTADEFGRGCIEGFKNIPVDELRERINEIEKGKPVYLICQSGLRSYIASRILEGNGYETYNFSGGFRFYDAVVNDRALIEKAYACGMDY